MGSRFDRLRHRPGGPTLSVEAEGAGGKVLCVYIRSKLSLVSPRRAGRVAMSLILQPFGVPGASRHERPSVFYKSLFLPPLYKDSCVI